MMTDSGTSVSVSELLVAKKWVEEQLSQYNVAQNAASKLQKEQNQEPDAENLLSRVTELQEEVAEAASECSIKNLIIRRLQLGETLYNHVFPPQHGEAGDASHHTDSDTIELLERQTALSKEILKTHKEIQEIQPQVDALKKDNLDLKKEIRELMYELEQKKEAASKQRVAAESNVRIKKSMERVELVQDKVELVRHIFQGLVLGSGINWAKDEELRDLVIQLGKPVEDVIAALTEDPS